MSEQRPDEHQRCPGCGVLSTEFVIDPVLLRCAFKECRVGTFRRGETDE